MEQVNTPNFLVIGTPKSGSTWLQFVLSSHPDIYIPQGRNEIHYFDREIKKQSQEWYLKFFKEARSESAIGEVTPHYLYVEDQSIFRTVPSIEKFILIIRNPVDRCISHYKFRRRIDNYQKDFESFLRDYAESLEWGMYGKWIERFLNEFEREQLLVLSFESATRDPEMAIQQIAGFLNVDQEGFDLASTKQRVNAGFAPKNPLLYKLSITTSRILLRLNLDGLRNALKRALKPMVSRKKVTDNQLLITEGQKEYLWNFYETDLQKLEDILGELDADWKGRKSVKVSGVTE